MPDPNSVTRHSAFKWTVHTEIVIDAPPAEVWKELTNFAEMPSWSQGLHSMTGDLRTGGHVVVLFVDDKGKVGRYEHDLILYEEGVAFGWSDPILPGLRDHHIYRLTPTEDGKTLLTQDDGASGVTALFLGRYATNFMLNNFRTFNEALKARVEAKQSR